MPTLADFGLAARPYTSRGATNASAEPVTRYTPSVDTGARQGNYLADTLLADQVQRKEATNAEAETIVRNLYPNLFDSREKISADLQKRGLKGTALSNAVNRTISNNRYTVKTEQAARLKQLQSSYDQQYEEQVRSSNTSRRAEDTKHRDINYRTQQEGGTIAQQRARQEAENAGAGTEAQAANNLTREQKIAQSQAEAALTAQFISDPQYQSSFQQISDYLEQLRVATPEEQQQIQNDMKSLANALVDMPFDRAVQIQRDNLSRKLRQLQDTYQELSENEQLKLETAVQNLDVDTAKDLNDKFDDIFRRAGTDSGILRRVADELITTHDIGEQQKQKERDQALKHNELIRQQGAEDAQATTDENVFALEQQRTAARSAQLSDLVSESEQMSLYRAQAAGGNEVQTPSTVTPLASIRSTISPSLSAPVGSSLDLARQAAAGTITPAQQASQRNALLMSPQPVAPSTARVQPAATTLWKSGDYAGSIAARRNARISARI